MTIVLAAVLLCSKRRNECTCILLALITLMIHDLDGYCARERCDDVSVKQERMVQYYIGMSVSS